MLGCLCCCGPCSKAFKVVMLFDGSSTYVLLLAHSPHPPPQLFYSFMCHLFVFSTFTSLHLEWCVYHSPIVQPNSWQWHTYGVDMYMKCLCLQDMLYNFMRARYLVEDVMYLATHDFLSSIIELSGINKVFVWWGQPSVPHLFPFSRQHQHGACTVWAAILITHYSSPPF